MSEATIAQIAGLTLTDIRLRQRYANQVKSALLEEINAAAVVYHSNPIWLVLAAIAIALGLVASVATSSGVPLVVTIALAAVLVITYFLSRQVVFVVYAGSMQLRETLQGNALDQAVAFIDAIELAKQKVRNTG